MHKVSSESLLFWLPLVFAMVVPFLALSIPFSHEAHLAGPLDAVCTDVSVEGAIHYLVL